MIRKLYYQITILLIFLHVKLLFMLKVNKLFDFRANTSKIAVLYRLTVREYLIDVNFIRVDFINSVIVLAYALLKNFRLQPPGMKI